MILANPFGVRNPEQLDVDYIVRNFVDVYTDLPRLQDKCNTFILGARGAGKSMLLRSLEPEVMLKAGKCETIADLPYVAVHVPLKKAEFSVPELNRLTGYASFSVGEHQLAMHVMFRIAKMLRDLSKDITGDDAQKYMRRFSALFALSAGELPPKSATAEASSEEIFAAVEEICEHEIIRIRHYIKQLSFPQPSPAYSGALTGFLDFVVPLAEQIRRFKSLPKVPLFLMLDDADNLPKHIQRVLNSWVSARTTHAVCLKVTTQLGYATLRTVDNRIIESPHDFDEVDLSTVYTTDHERYSNRVKEIVIKRLENSGIKATPDTLFPRDERQAKRLSEIEEEIRKELESERSNVQGANRGPARARDAVTRYAVPRLMRELAGSARSSHTYSYAGFKSLVDLSSGVVRWFLEPASRMYHRVLASGSQVVSIPVEVQDEIIRDWSREFIARLSHRIDHGGEGQSEIEPEPDEDASLHAFGHETVLYDRLKNLLDGLGRIFRERLLDPIASEQRVFSIVVRGPIPVELRHVLGLAVRLGYLQSSDNASKEALGGRLPRYVLARRLGPYYNLDISGYAAHLSVVGYDLARALQNPSEFAATRLRKRGDDAQLALTLSREGDGIEGHQ